MCNQLQFLGPFLQYWLWMPEAMATPTQMPSRYSPCTTPKTALRYLPAHCRYISAHHQLALLDTL